VKGTRDSPIALVHGTIDAVGALLVVLRISWTESGLPEYRDKEPVERTAVKWFHRRGYSYGRASGKVFVKMDMSDQMLWTIGTTYFCLGLQSTSFPGRLRCHINYPLVAVPEFLFRTTSVLLILLMIIHNGWVRKDHIHSSTWDGDIG